MGLLSTRWNRNKLADSLLDSAGLNHSINLLMIRVLAGVLFLSDRDFLNQIKEPSATLHAGDVTSEGGLSDENAKADLEHHCNKNSTVLGLAFIGPLRTQIVLHDATVNIESVRTSGLDIVFELFKSLRQLFHLPRVLDDKEGIPCGSPPVLLKLFYQRIRKMKEIFGCLILRIQTNSL